MKLNDIHEAGSYLILAFQKGIGDQLTCSSLIRNVARNRPGAAIDLAVFTKTGRDLYQYNPYIRNIHIIDMDYLDFFKIGGKYRLREKIEYVRTFRRFKYDAAYILGTKIRFALFTYLIGAKERIGYTAHHGFINRRRGLLLTKTGKSSLQKNIVERFLDLLAIDGMRIYDPAIELFLSKKEDRAAEDLFSSAGISPQDRVITMAPFASDAQKTWPLDRFWAVASHFAEKGYTVIILGSAQDRALVQKMPPPGHPHIIDYTGKLDILETAAVIKRGAFFLGNDSGCGHIAGAVRTNALILGFYLTRFWHPLSPSVKMIVKETGCTMCTFDSIKKCTDSARHTAPCFALISVREVVAAIEEQINGSRPSTAR